MKIISFDIGIKNMAYCTIDCSSTINIENWNILNLVEENNTDSVCNQSNKTNKNICTSKAKYKKGSHYFCKKHAICSPFMIPSKDTQLNKLKSKKKEMLLKWGKQHYLFMENKLLSKGEMLTMIGSYLKSKCLEEIINPVKKANKYDLITIGRKMKELLNEIVLEDVDYVIIENQISPIANRMTTIQGMLAQYFIMKYPSFKIEFISSANKLKPFSKMASIDQYVNTTNVAKHTNNVNPNYKAHKQDSVKICSTITSNNFTDWETTLQTKKQDDLADAFLQGLWFIFNKNKISYADDLKINIVSLS